MASTKPKKVVRSAKEIQQITDRLYGSAPANTQRNTAAQNKPQKILSKEEIDSCVDRLFDKNFDSKRKELQERHHQNFDKTRSEKYGWQKVNKEELEATTSRLFVADYTKRFVDKQPPRPKIADKEMSKEEYEAAIERLHVKNYNNKNLTKNKEFI